MLSGISRSEKYLSLSFLFSERSVKRTKSNNNMIAYHIYQVNILKAFSLRFQLGSSVTLSRDWTQGKKSDVIQIPNQKMLTFDQASSSRYL